MLILFCELMKECIYRKICLLIYCAVLNILRNKLILLYILFARRILVFLSEP